MTGNEIIQRFRDENPEIDVNVIPDAILTSWLTVGDSEVCAKSRLIIKEDVAITPVVNQSTYDLTLTDPKFFDINEMPGGGIARFTSNTYKRLDKTTKSYLDYNVSQWRMASSGVPKYYYRSGKNMIVYPKPNSTVTGFTVDIVLLSDTFSNMSVTPFNQLPYLAPFHYALVLYLAWRAKNKVGKGDEAMVAFNIYSAYVEWMKKEIGGGKYGPIEFRPSGLPSQGYMR